MKRSVLTALTAALVAVLSLGFALGTPETAGAATTLSLTVSPSTVTYGNETSVVFSVSINDILAGGKVSVQEGSTPICTATLTAQAGTCSSSSDTLLPPSASPYSITASFSDILVGTFTSAPMPLTVAPDPTTTTVSLSPPSPASVTYGQESTLVFTAGVTPQDPVPGTPTGTINVDAGSTPACSITLPATTCSTMDDPVPASGTPYAVTANYVGDGTFAASASTDPQSLAVGQATTSTTLSLSSSSVTFGDESTLQVTATVAPQVGALPSGTITVTADGNPLCTITLPATTCAPLADEVLPTGGPYALTASYAGDTNFTASMSNPEQQLTVSPGNTTTSLTVSPSSVAYGNESTVTFSTVLSLMQSGTPTGTMTVTAGPTILCSFDVTKATSCSTTDMALPASGSPYPVVAAYSGDGGFTPSSSDPENLTVNQDPTTTSFSAPSSVVYGNEGSITFSPTVSPQFNGTPTGPVTVSTGATTLCTFTLPAGTGCSATNTLLPVSGSPYPLTARYGGDTNFMGSSATATQNLTVTPGSTTTILAISSPTVTYGNESSLTFTATVAPEFAGTPSGTVNVMAGAMPLCAITLPATTCSTTDDPLHASGSADSVTAAYQGDTNFSGSTSPTKTLTVNQAVTTTSLTVSPTTVTFGSESTVVFTATLTQPFSGTPTGTITVATPATTLCVIDLPATNLTCSTNDDPLAPSSTPYAVTAGYSGDTNFTGSTSGAQDLTISSAGTTTTLSPSASSVTYGDEGAVTFNAAVTPSDTGGPQPTGVVTVATPTVTLCTFNVATATSCTATATALGASGTPYQVTATYGGDTNYGSSASSSSPLTVTKASTTTALSPSVSVVTYGDEQSVTFTATLTPQFAGVPTGTITVSAGATTLCTITLPATSCTTLTGAKTNPLNASGTAYALVATYSGDANLTGSADTSQTLTVNQASTSASLTIAPSSVAFGDESTVVFTATITPEFAGSNPSGVVSVATSATTLCTITLPATTCSTTDQILDPSGTPYTVAASYRGDTNFTAPTSTPTSSLTITGGTSTTALSLSSSSVPYGNETSVVYIVTVSPLKAGTPSGTATVAIGTTTICMVTLTEGSGTCSPSSDTQFPASGTPYEVIASYSGDSNFTRSSGSNNLTVTPDGTGTTLTVSPSSVTYGAESGVTFSVTLTPEFPGTPTGTVTVVAGSTTLCSFTLPATSCSTGQTALGAGGYTVTATYGGDRNFQSSSGTHGLTVNPATPSSPSITNVPSGAAEEGSFVASVTTTGDGTRTVVSDTMGTCTVGSDGVTVSFLVAGSCTLTPQVASGENFTGAAGSPQTFTIAFGPRGYWLVGSDGGIFSFGAAQFYGSMGGTPLQRPVVGITPTHSKNGYWLVASDGGLFAFGNANYFGSIPGLGLHPAGSGLPNSLDAPIVAMVPSTTGNGYFMVASDGGVFAFGDARFAGSCPGIGGCAGSAVAVMPDHSGNGYWLVTSAGSIYAFGDAPFFGAPSPQSSPVVNAVATPDGAGYWILYANGTVLNFGDATAYGNPVGYVNGFNPATSIFPTTDGLGYWVASAKGDVFSYGNAPFLGSMSATPLNGPIIAAFGF